MLRGWRLWHTGYRNGIRTCIIFAAALAIVIEARVIVIAGCGMANVSLRQERNQPIGRLSAFRSIHFDQRLVDVTELCADPF